MEGTEISSGIVTNTRKWQMTSARVEQP